MFISVTQKAKLKVKQKIYYMSDKIITKVDTPVSGLKATIADAIGFGRDHNYGIQTIVNGETTTVNFGNSKTERDEKFEEMLKK